jgi:para-aminobenzoate synthetase component 2
MVNFINYFSAVYKHKLVLVLLVFPFLRTFIFVIQNSVFDILFFMRLLLINNHDSFTWNLVELLRRTNKVNVNIITPEQLIISKIWQYDQILFSPGPGLPEEQPEMFTILSETEQRRFRKQSSPSIFGVCLGMQAIAIHFGGRLFNLPEVVHGQPRKLNILDHGHPLFRDIPNGSQTGLYHSWAVDPGTLPLCLEPLATSHDGTIMALAHKTLPICGVQFHPESIMTPTGQKMIENWLTMENPPVTRDR